MVTNKREGSLPFPFFIVINIFIVNKKNMNSRILNEELYKMKHLFGYQRGVVISEQEYDSPNWRGKSKGDMDLTNPYGKYAINVGYEGKKYTLTSISQAPRITSEKKVETFEKPGDVTLQKLDLSKNAFPYPDNMIGPKFESFPEAQKVYENFVMSLRDFINAGGINNIKSIKIQGTADAARPTLDVPKGYSSLDHSLVGDNSPYGGLKSDLERNQYLADNRAKVLGNMIIDRIKKETGVDISSKIQYIKGINYFGQQDKRGFEFKKVTVEPDYTQLSRKEKVGQTTTGSSSNSTATPESNSFIDLTQFGSKKIPVKMINRAGGQVAAIARKVSDENKLLNIKEGGFLPLWTVEGLNQKSTVRGEIRNGELFVDNTSFGKIVYIDPSEISTDYDNRSESTTRYVTVGRPVIIGGDENYDFVRTLKFAFSEL